MHAKLLDTSKGTPCGKGLGRNEGLGSWPGRRARMTPDRTALVFDGQAHHVCRAGRPGPPARAVLRDGGVASATGSPTSGPTTPRSWRRSSPPRALGAVFVPLNTRLAAPGADLHARRLRRLGAGVRPRARRRRWPGRRLPDAGATGSRSAGEYEELLAGAPAEPLDVPVALDDVVHDHVHVGDDRAPEGRDAHPRQPDLELLQPAGRPRPRRRRGRAGQRAAVPHGGAEPHGAAGVPQGRHERAGRASSTRRAPST